MFWRFWLIVLSFLLPVLPAFAQSAVTIEPDLRLFATMAALNAAGFDIEYGSQYHPVREIVRGYAEGVDPDLIERMRAFYEARRGDQPHEAQMAKYISLAVGLTAPPEMKPGTRQEFMPPDARSVAGFADLIREYYEKARISQRWVEVRPEYEKAIAKIGPPLRDMIVRTDAYLRVPLGGVTSRRMDIYFELAAPINTVNFRSYQDNYYVVLGDSTSLRLDEIRHAYLHFQLDNLVASNASKVQNANALLGLVAKAEGVDPAYTSEFHIMAGESLIRALELRIDRTPARVARENVDMFYRSGLLLTPYFYGALEVYELGDSGIRDDFSALLKGIQFKAEQQRFLETFDKIPIPTKTVSRSEVPQPPPAPPADPVRDLLKEGESALNADNRENARKAFEKVLSDFDRDNGAALYGLALIESMEGDSQEAEQYFERSIRAESIEPSMKVWAYIYLGRIYDLECNRERAIQYYQQATKVGDDTRNAQAAALQGIRQPYGGGCKGEQNRN